MSRTVILATGNAHKVAELQAILGPLVPELIVAPYDGPSPVEDGVTFAENALIKARAAALHTGLPAIADDSGIAVDVLGGAPGIFSARWAGPHRDASANVDLLLGQLADVRDGHRGAAFVCAAALVLPGGGEMVREGVWRGRVLRERRGEGGFGYDPVFQPDDEARSAAELTPDEKNTVSHRALAFGALATELIRLP